MLREHTKFSHVKCNETRWYSVKYMLERYFQIRGHLSSLDIPEIENLMPKRPEQSALESLMKTMNALDCIKVSLQKRDTKLSDVRIFF